MKRKVAMITGATKGIGRAIAIKYMDLGYDLVLNYRTDKLAADEMCEMASSKGVKAIGVYADMTKIEDIKAMCQEAFDEFDAIDVLVNNAGAGGEVYFLDATEEDFDHINKLDWKAVFITTQIVTKRMIEKNIQGLIINISSNQVEGCWPRATVYASVKAAVSKFTKNVAMELAPYGIRLVALSPGYTDTGWPKDSHLHKAKQYLPLKRFATPEEIAEGAAFLVSEGATYMTGCTLTMDGGATLPVVACNDFVEQ